MQSAEYETMFRVEERHWWYGALHRWMLYGLSTYLPGWRNCDILDAGCGTGGLLQKLGHPQKHVGIDLAPEALEFCRRRGLHNVQQADLLALPFAEESFDAVICSSVLYHAWVADVASALRELRRVLRPRGILLLNLPAFEFLRSPHDAAVLTARRFTRPEVRDLLRDGGFEIEQLTCWTSLLFPAAVAARTFGWSRSGRDFDTPAGEARHNRFFSGLMALEFQLLRRIPLPFGVALFGVARKRADFPSGSNGTAKSPRSERTTNPHFARP